MSVANKALTITLTACLIYVVGSLVKCSVETQKFAAEKRLTATVKSDPVEVSYRECIKREAGMVGVASINQMRKCESETGYGK